MRIDRFVVVAVIAGMTAAHSARAQSPMFRGDPSHRGATSEAAPAQFGGLAWRFQTDGTVRASVAVANGRAVIGSTDGSVYALDPHSGAERWRFKAGAGVSSTAAIGGGLTFVQDDAGTLHALDSRTGVQRWSHPARTNRPLGWGFENGDYYTSSPVLFGSLVITAGRDGFIVARDAAGGAERWRYDAGAQLWASPAVDAGLVIVGDQQGTVHAIDATSGARRWRFDTFGHGLNSASFGFDRRTVQSSPAVADGTVYIGARDGFLYAIRESDGTEQWRFDHKVSWVNSSPAIHGDLVIATSSDAAFVSAVDRGSGKERWRTEGLGLMWGSPLVAGNHLFVGAGNGVIYALNATTGAREWTYRVDAPVFSSPVAADGLLLFGADDGGVYAVRGDRALQRVVYWDSTQAKVNLLQWHEELRDHLDHRGFRVLGADSLAAFVAARISDHAPSVIVFAMDQVPPSLGRVPADTVPFRRYLNAGGKIVWPGVPPMLWPHDEKGLDIARIDRSACVKLIGVDCAPANFNDWRAEPTTEGRRLGLSGWWTARWSVVPSSVTTVLAKDQWGNASSFVKEYGGAPGSGFVRLSGGDNATAVRAGAKPVDFPTIRRIAETFPLPPRP